MKQCPVCGCEETIGTVERARLPVVQNRVYPSRAEALNAPSAAFRLNTCVRCGFSFNGLFDSGLVVYDEYYDNDVPSKVFRDYYEQLASMLIERFGLDSGTVYDIGCGKGDFLRTLCRLAPGIHGVGIDPSCTPVSDRNFTLVRDTYQAGKFAADTKLGLLRHVLEHIDQPVGFAAGIAEALNGAPFFVEVPDAEWIFDNGVFWDFCYEHCNYFTPKSLAQALRASGFDVEAQQLSFGGQYQWAICRPAQNPQKGSRSDGLDDVEKATRYQRKEAELIQTVRTQVAKAENPVLWGMATKGVIFSNLLGPDAIAGGVDINTKKQGRFVPGSGVEVHPPEWLKHVGDTPTVFVMNGNYADEISRTISSLGIRSRLIVP